MEEEGQMAVTPHRARDTWHYRAGGSQQRSLNGPSEGAKPNLSPDFRLLASNSDRIF